MAEKEPEKKKGGIFGGKSSMKEDLRDISGDEKVTFADTWLGDLLGADGSFGVQGPGLRRSWFGARRDGPGSKANKPNLIDLERMEAMEQVLKEEPTATSIKTPTVTTTRLSSVNGGRGDGLTEMARRAIDRADNMDTVKDIGLPKPKITPESPEQPPESRLMKNSEFGMGTAEQDVGVEAGRTIGLMSRPSSEKMPLVSAENQTAFFGDLLQVLGSKSKTYKDINELLSSGGKFKKRENLTKIIKEVQAAPKSEAKSRALDKLYQMRDALK